MRAFTMSKRIILMSMPFHTATSNIDQHDKPYWVAQGYRAAKLGQTFESMKTGHGGPDRWIKQGFNKYASRLQKRSTLRRYQVPA